ncbi:Protein of unknown function [Haloechinothrix alba]|uniref:DUF3515 domain-containing protein n=1 Tax=Haloechinothrix alba TaxID=664784 RepID=A0A238VMW5_9PSEU|nr:DUF3515 domain-containing protein [Haloechinothrix alba]SNR35576.1 Protein of unknown function [Haloechinothrix alba]
MPDDTDRSEDSTPPRALLVVAAALALTLAAAAAVIGLVYGSEPEDERAGDGSALAVPGVPAPDADTQACGSVLDATPDRLPIDGDGDDTADRRELAEPAPPATTAWGLDDPIVLRCGVEQPGELAPDSPLRAVNGVEWLPVEGAGSHTWYAVDRGVYIALTVPDSAGTGPLQVMSETIDGTLDARPVEVE